MPRRRLIGEMAAAWKREREQHAALRQHYDAFVTQATAEILALKKQVRYLGEHIQLLERELAQRAPVTDQMGEMNDRAPTAL